MDDDNSILPPLKRTPWNKGKLIGAKPPLLGGTSSRTGNLRVDISESRSMMRSPSLSKSKSELSGQSGQCSARLLAALRATTGLMQCSKPSIRSPRRRGRHLPDGMPQRG